MAKLSNPIIPVTTDLTDGLVHILVPDETSETGYTSKKIVLEDHIQPGGIAVWGEIEGTIQDQTDLMELIQGLKTISKGNTFTPAIVFDKDEKYFNQYEQDGELTISLDENTNGANSYIYVNILTDGNDINFPEDWVEILNEYSGGGGIYSLAIFFDGLYYQYSFYKLIDIDISNPLLNTASISNDTKDTIDLVFSEIVNITTSGWSITTDGAALSISSVSGSGTSTPTFTLSRDIVGGEVITLDYDENTGDTDDESGNILESITDFSITNNVELDYTDFTFNLLRASQTGTIVSITATNDFGIAVGTKSFAGDFEIIFDGDDPYVSGQGDILGLLESSNLDTNNVNYKWIRGTAFYYNNSVDGGGTISYTDNYKVKFERISGTVKVYQSADEVSWSLMKTFAQSNTNTLYFKWMQYGTTAKRGKLYNARYKEL